MPTRSDSPVRQASLREHNLALVLRRIAAAPTSRAEVAAATGLTRATVSTLVEELLAGRLVAEREPAPRNGAGRPATGLVLDPTGAAGLGLEVNVDYLAACVVDLTGAVRYRSVQAGDQRRRGPARVFAALARLAGAARAAAIGQDLTLAGTALAVPGLIEDGRVIRLAPNLGWRDVTPPEDLGTPDNEANLAALGELRCQPPDGPASFLYVSGEIGVGAGIVLDGQLFRGRRGWSGELGHVTIEPDGPACRCGARGCLEQYAGQEAILRAAGAAEGHKIVDAAKAGDPRMRDALAGAGRALGVAVAGVVNLLDLDTVVLGGSYAPLAPWLLPAVTAELATRVVTSDWAPVTVRPSLLGNDAAVVGAAGSVVRTVLDHPARWLAP